MLDSCRRIRTCKPRGGRSAHPSGRVFSGSARTGPDHKEIAELLGLNPATSLHHVRTLLNTGFLEAEERARATGGAKEVPYRSTRMSWGKMPDAAPVLVETFLQEIEAGPRTRSNNADGSSSSTTRTARRCWQDPRDL